MIKQYFLLFTFILINHLQGYTQSINPAPYCDAEFSDIPSNTQDYITSFSIGGMTCNSNNHWPFPHYVLYDSIPYNAWLYMGASNTFTIEFNLTSTNNLFYGIWIDFDQSNTFDAAEAIHFGPITSNIITANYLIPLTAQFGVTRIRARIMYDSLASVTSACGTLSSGETEDYIGNISFFGPTGLPSAELSTLSVFPNPVTQGILHVNHAEGMVKQLFNSVGQLVMQTTAQEMNVSPLAPGVYWLVAQDVHQKVIISAP